MNEGPCVYIMLCADTTFYIGSTSDIKKRLHEHNHTKNGAHYTKIRRPVVLVYSEYCKTIQEARAREVQLKKYTRAQKEQLIALCK